MAKYLVIVESPAKAKTIAQYLGADFDVRASIGHVADLPSKGLAVDVNNGFKPSYELTDRGRKVVSDLRSALKSAQALYLATDEDREGEAISWHLLEYLKPKVPVHRMVFHEINKKAIQHALENPRDINYGLVDAADTRRILDRLYGYEVSPVLWRRVNRGLSAGRVQSPTIKLIVEREQARIDFRAADYFSLQAVTDSSPSFVAKLVSLSGSRIATGKDFDQQGNTTAQVFVLDAARSRELLDGLKDVPLQVRSVDPRPYRSSPRAPFTTSTLQQEAGRKLRLSGREVMRVAQSLYEGGFITYMRTDSVTLSDEAIAEIRAHIQSESTYRNFLPASPRTYTNKVKNAQEAHEAIRPALPLRRPEQVAKDLNAQELNLYRLIWQRTIASQMTDATGTTITVRLGATAHDPQRSDCEFSASGTTIDSAGYRAAYEEAKEEDSEETDEDAMLLPPLTQGQSVPVREYAASSHTTSPPPRYTEASLVKMLEEKGIGRPSTWAAIISQMVERGHYVWKKGTALVPTWTAFTVTKLLDENFEDLVDYEFTAGLDEDLDSIARGEQDKVRWLHDFYWGNGEEAGLHNLVESRLDSISAAEINTRRIGDHPDTGETIVVRSGKYGPYVQCGENRASVPEGMAPDELSVDVAVGLLNAPKGDEPIGEWNGHPVFAKTGRYGPYVQWGTMEAPPEGMEKPKMASLFKTMNIERITMQDAVDLLSLPRTLGVDPADGVPVTAQNGRFGPYISKGNDSRSLQNEEQLLTVTLEDALGLLAQPRTFGRRGAPKPPLREFGNDPISGKPVVGKEGRFGMYVTDGETNASLSRGDRMESMIPERAFELLQARREYDEANPKKAKKGRKSSTAKKAAEPKKPAARKAPAKKKAAPKKAAAKKKAAPKKAAAKPEEPAPGDNE